jgi:oligosaccharide repeat unit polymerase
VSADLVFWCWTFAAVLAAVGVYCVEVYRFGGMGMGTPCVAGVIVYSLLNPALYVLSPALTLSFGAYVGWDHSAESLLPNAASVCLFIVGVGISSICGRRLRRQYRAPAPAVWPLRRNQMAFFVLIGIGCIAAGLLMYGVRNYLMYGSPMASFRTSYAGAEARPRVAVWAAYVTMLQWGILALSCAIFWQVSARRLKRFYLVVPLLAGAVFAVIEGDRLAVATAALYAFGWYTFQKRIGLRHIAGGLLLVTFLTVLASARYNKTEHGFLERFGDIVAPENFRPFWSSDPAGPATVATLEAERVGDGSRLAWGEDYVRNFASVIPGVVWAGKPDDSATKFAKWYSGYFAWEYFPGTGFAYSMVTEAFVNFWYPGVFVFGVLWGILVGHINLRCVCRRDGSGKVVFAGLMTMLPLALSRGYLAGLVSPTALLTYILIGTMRRYVCVRKGW